VTEPVFFETPAAFRAWLEEHHDRETELIVGFYKVGSGKPSITWPQAVDEALCFGWIDGVRRGIDADSYSNRFTPRKPSSHWSAVNVKRVAALMELGRMRPPGLAAFERRRDDRTAQASYEGNRALDAASEAQLRANPTASAYFHSQAPYYQRAAAHWVMSAKRDETRARRLRELIDDSANARRIKPMRDARE
jgi:uncharacterized protein YdeI (YjbR/CyaY-like superfamily)